MSKTRVPVIATVLLGGLLAGCPSESDDGSQMKDGDRGDGGAEGQGFESGGVRPDVTCKTKKSKAGECKELAEGVYAIKEELDVWWQDEVNGGALALMDPGRGKITIYFRTEASEVCDDGSSALAKIHPCGTTLPTIVVDTTCTALKINFPDDLWEKPGIPDYYTTGSISGFEPGDTLTVMQRSFLLGVELANVDDPWPKPSETASFDCGGKTGEECFPDQDDDGAPGVTVHFAPLSGKYTMADGAPYKCRTGADFTYDAAPVSLLSGALRSAGAESAYLGMRVSMGGGGVLAPGCKSGVGKGTADSSQSARVFNCVREPDASGKSEPCTASEAMFVDQNTPPFHVLMEGETPPSTWIHNREKTSSGAKDPNVTLLDRMPSKGPRVSVVRLDDVGATVSCKQIRTAKFPDFE